MGRVKFGDVVREVKLKIDRNNNPYAYYIAGGHMDSEDLTIRRKGVFETDDVGPAFIRIFKKGQILYGSRRTYLKKVAVADFDGITSNTTFVLETIDNDVLLQELIPFIMLSSRFTEWSIKRSKGSTNPYVLFSDLKDYEFDLPTLEDQLKLSNLLWAMDYTKNKYMSLIEKTNELVKSQFIEMFDKRFNEVPISSMVEKKIKKIKTLPDEIDHIKYIDISSIDNNAKRVTSYTNFSIEDAPSRAQQVLEKGDILVSTVRPNLRNIAVNHYAEESVIGSTGFCVLRPISYLPEYVLGVVSSDKFTNKMCESASGISYPAVRNKDVLNYMAPDAPLELQNEFAEFVKQSDKSKFELEKSMKSLEMAYKKIIDENLN